MSKAAGRMLGGTCFPTCFSMMKQFTLPFSASFFLLFLYDFFFFCSFRAYPFQENSNRLL